MNGGAESLNSLLPPMESSSERPPHAGENPTGEPILQRLGEDTHFAKNGFAIRLVW